MFIGLLIFLLAIFVILVGTKRSDALALYYDAEVESEEPEQEEMTEGSSDEAEPDIVLEPEYMEEQGPEVKSTGAESRKRMSVSYAGTKVQGSVRGGSGSVESLDELKKAGKKFDPTQRAQSLFDIASGKERL